MACDDHYENTKKINNKKEKYHLQILLNMNAIKSLYSRKLAKNLSKNGKTNIMQQFL